MLLQVTSHVSNRADSRGEIETGTVCCFQAGDTTATQCPELN